jgi:hypothetical protein
MKGSAKKKQRQAKKPGVAFISEQHARENLQRKLRALSTLLKSGARPPQVPTSLRRFNAWTVDRIDDESALRRNANETLARYPALKATAIELVQRAKATSKPPVNRREASVARARERANLHLTIRQIAEAALMRARLEINSLQMKLTALQGQLDSVVDESVRIRAEYEEALSNLRAQHAELLRARPTNIRPIR